MSQLQTELRRVAQQYVCHVKAAELDVSFGDCWRAMFPREQVLPEPNWDAESSRHLLLGMRAKNDFVEALCRKYQV